MKSASEVLRPIRNWLLLSFAVILISAVILSRRAEDSEAAYVIWAAVAVLSLILVCGYAVVQSWAYRRERRAAEGHTKGLTRR